MGTLVKSRPLSITLLGWLYIATGCIGLAYHSADWKTPSADHWAIVWISAVRALAVVAGFAMLRGQNWARWLTLAWIAFHVGISFFDGWEKVAIHAVFLVVIAWVLMRKNASEYFASKSS